MKALQTPARTGSPKLICKVLRDYREQAASVARLAPRRPRTLMNMFTMSLSAQHQGMAHRAFMNMFAMSRPATTERKGKYRIFKMIAP